MSKIISKGDIQLGSKSSHTSVKTKAHSFLSKKSRSGSYTSAHGSRFGRSVCRFPKQNDPETVLTLSTSNSRVIPAMFDFKIEPGSKFPDLTVTEATESIRQLGKALNILDYEFNFASFWALDILSQNLAELQLESFSVENQKLFLGWFSYVLRCISISGAAREDGFMLLQDLFKKAVNIMEEGGDIPYPRDIKTDSSIDHVPTILSNELQSIASSNSNGSVSSERKSSSRKSSKKSISFKSLKRSLKSSSKKSSKGSISVTYEEQLKLKLNAFYKIIEILYKIFADRFMYSAISLAYSSPAITTPVDIQFEFNEIKQPKPEPVVIPSARNKSPKGKKSVSKERKKSKEKGKKKSSVKGKKKKSKSTIEKPSKKGSKGNLQATTDAPTEDASKKKEKTSKKGSKGNLQATTDAPAEDASKKKGKPDKKKRKSRSKSKASDAFNENESRESKKSKPKRSKNKKESTVGKEDYKEVETKDPDKSTKKKSVKSKGGKEKTRSKSEGAETEKSGKTEGKNKETKKGKKDKKSKSSTVKTKRKSKKSTIGSSSLRESAVDQILQARTKMFERTQSPGMQPEEEKMKSINQFILPLSEAVDEKFVENLIKSILPPEPEREENKEANVEDSKKRRKASKKSKKSSVKSKKSSVKGLKSKKGKKKK